MVVRTDYLALRTGLEVEVRETILNLQIRGTSGGLGTGFKFTASGLDVTLP